MTNPVMAEAMRGGIVESRHTGAFAVVNRKREVILAAGDIDAPVFPRSAIKAFQCLPVIESGAAERFGFTNEDISLACASHNGEPEHVQVARAMLRKVGLTEHSYECGAHWPTLDQAFIDLARAGSDAQPVHNNCSGKHAGMLALSMQIGADPHGYVKREHAVQMAIAEAIGRMCECNLDDFPCGIDGCSVPTWAIPLRKMALGFAKFTDPINAAAQRIIAAVRAFPFMVAGTGSFDTEFMSALPRAFMKTGAEGVYCGCIAHAGLGIALKCDDGATRGAEMAFAAVLSKLDCWTPAEMKTIGEFMHRDLTNWSRLRVGEVHAAL